MYFYFPLDFHSDAWIKCLEIFLLPFCCLFLIGFPGAGDYTTLPIIFNFLRFCFMGQEMVYLVLCSAGTWEESVSIVVGWRVQWMLVWACCWGCCHILLCPPRVLLGCCAVVGRAVLRSPTVLVDVYFSPLGSLSLFLHILCSSDVVPIHLGLLRIVDVSALTRVLLILINVCMI